MPCRLRGTLRLPHVHASTPACCLAPAWLVDLASSVHYRCVQGPHVTQPDSTPSPDPSAGASPRAAGGPPGNSQTHALDEVLGMYPAVGEDHLRELQKQRLVSIATDADGRRMLSFAGVLVLRRLHGELVRGASFRAVVRSMRATNSGQLALEFRKDPSPATVVALTEPPVVVQARARLGDAGVGSHAPPVVDETLAEEAFGLASTLDDGTPENQERAAAAYRRALEADPHLVPAIINLANIHYAKDELIEAQALYEHAISIDSDVFEGFFNLGNIHHDMSRFREAEGYYLRALAIIPGHPGVHLYLAVVLEKSERPDEARVHWQQYRNLSPNGEWADLAREFCDT